jgi:hypothetical protein
MSIARRAASIWKGRLAWQKYDESFGPGQRWAIEVVADEFANPLFVLQIHATSKFERRVTPAVWNDLLLALFVDNSNVLAYKI